MTSKELNPSSIIGLTDLFGRFRANSPLTLHHFLKILKIPGSLLNRMKK